MRLRMINISLNKLITFTCSLRRKHYIRVNFFTVFLTDIFKRTIIPSAIDQYNYWQCYVATCYGSDYKTWLLRKHKQSIGITYQWQVIQSLILNQDKSL